jgi:photosystem II stability/assembly factor-like uncharacterized protein
MSKSAGRIGIALLLTVALGATAVAGPGAFADDVVPAPASLDAAAASAQSLLDSVTVATGRTGYVEEEGEEAGPGPEDPYLFAKTSGEEFAPRSALVGATRQSRKVQRLTARRAPGLAKARWKLHGPANIGGRIVDLAIDPKQKDTVYIASASGGVWRTTDAGKTFKSIWKNSMPQSMGALVIAKNGTLYAGTGEANPGGGSITYGGAGVYKSTNRGRTWKFIGLGKGSRIGRMAVDPKDPNHVYVAVAGNLFTPGGERGLYETTNGGTSWKRVLEGDNETTGAIDVHIHPKNSKIVFAALWDHTRFPDRRQYAGLGSGIYKSTDGGKTWARLGPTNGLPPPHPEGGRIGIGIAPSDPNRMYAIYSNSALGSLSGFFISEDGGETWLESSGAPDLADSQFVYSWWFGRIWVDPKDPMHVFVAGVSLMESTDGGQRFPITHGGIHADQHAMEWDPHTKNRIYLGNDGGFYRSDNNGAANTWVHSEYEPTLQFVSIDVSEQDPTRIVGGLQDNGSVRSWSSVPGRKTTWNGYYGGDGQRSLINPKDKNNIFGCSQYGACARSTDGGNTMQGFTLAATRFPFLTPLEFDPKDPNVMYAGGDIVNRSTDNGENWTPISPDLGGDPGLETNPLYAGHYGTVTSLMASPKDPATILAGTDNGRVWITHDTGGTWTELQHENLPERWVSRVTMSPTAAGTAYIAFSGYREGDNSAYVVKTTDGGETWTNITGNLPKAPVGDVIVVGKKLFVASDVGVFTSSLNGKRWLKVGGKSLPLAPVTDIRYIAKNKRIYAATFGRGIYSVKV